MIGGAIAGTVGGIAELAAGGPVARLRAVASIDVVTVEKMLAAITLLENVIQVENVLPAIDKNYHQLIDIFCFTRT